MLPFVKRGNNQVLLNLSCSTIDIIPPLTIYFEQMVTVSIVGGMIPICLGIYVMATAHMFWFPLFCFSLGLAIFSLNANSAKLTGFCVLAVVILYVIVYFAEPKWLDLLLKQLRSI